MSAPETIQAWSQRMGMAPIAAPGLLIGQGGLVVIAPHPDDETLGASALIAHAGDAGLPLGIVALTDGDASHPGSRAVPPEALAAIRRAEQSAAVDALGGGKAEWLRLALPDGASQHDASWPDALPKVADFCRRLGATAVAAPHPDDPHPDHHAAAAMALGLRDMLPGLRILFYEIWSYRLPDETPFRHHGLSPFRTPMPGERKRRALACHRSQLGQVVPDAPSGFTLPQWFLDRHDGPHERVAWLHMPGTCPAPGHFDRLYADGADPFNVRASPYEARKRAAALALLPRRRYGAVLELGCGEAHLLRDMIAGDRAGEATGMDRARCVIERASRDAPPSLTLSVGALPDDLPEGRFDLILLAEVLYYLPEPELARLAALLPSRLAEDAHLLIVSYKGDTQTPLDGIAAADFLAACMGPGLRPLTRQDGAGYRLDLFSWNP